jgi:alginate O-acetyltransferase complex protein AlgI
MLFNSYPFLFVFLPLAFMGTFVLGAFSRSLAIFWLGAASMVFYGFWDSKFVLLLLGSIVGNYCFGRWLEFAQQRGQENNPTVGRILFAAILLNLLVLGYFKYCNFFIGAFVGAFGHEFVPFNIILPLGISFFTFTQIGFLVDVSRGLTSEASLTRYLLFVTYFPHLIAGPLLHHKQVMPQFMQADAFRINTQNISVGLTIFILALAKKIFLADSFSEIVDPIYGSVNAGHQPMLAEAWVAALSYPLQLYFDFSAYSEMAIGLSLIFNVRLPLNFNSPFKATSVIDFWQRWHMSLTKYIYEYLYTPITLALMRKGLGRSKFVENFYTVILPTFITFAIIGLWHGANWTFVVFGVVHGLFMVINYQWASFRKKMGWRNTGHFYKLSACLLTYLAVVCATVFFRADTVGAAITILKGMVGSNGLSFPLTLQPWVTSVLPDSWINAHVVFEGVIPNSAFVLNPLFALMLITLGQAIVWTLPNLHQIMNQYNIVVEDMARKTLPTSATGSWSWHPTTVSAIIIGITLFAVVLTMATNRPSTFLYYQF